MTGTSLHSADDLHFDWWPLLRGKAYEPYTTALVLTLRPCGLPLLNDLDFKNDLDLDFQ